MNNTLKFILVFVGSGAAMFLIFYFYPAKIFDATFITASGAEVDSYISLKSLLGQKDPTLDEEIGSFISIAPKPAGYFIAFICIIGLPLMIALRVILSKKEKELE